MTDLVFVPSLLKPTFESTGIKSIEELMSYDTAEIQARLAWGGWGKRKKTLFFALQQLYRDVTHGPSVNPNSYMLSIISSELLPDVRLSQVTVGDFVNSSAEDWGLKGRRKRDFDSLKHLLNLYVKSSPVSGKNPRLLPFTRFRAL